MATYLQVLNRDEFLLRPNHFLVIDSKSIRMGIRGSAVDYSIFRMVPESGPPPGVDRYGAAGVLATEPAYAEMGYTKFDEDNIGHVVMQGDTRRPPRSPNRPVRPSRPDEYPQDHSVIQIHLKVAMDITLRPYRETLPDFSITLILLHLPVPAA